MKLQQITWVGGVRRGRYGDSVALIGGRYRLGARLGAGGMAEVFSASIIGAEGFSRQVAIKRILAGYSANSAFGKMFVAEAQLTSRLVHPNIVSVLDFDRDDEGRLFLVMELVDGCALDMLYSVGPVPFDVVAFVITEVLRGLGYAHAHAGGLVHRDVSPHNVLLSLEGSVKVSDFGIAKARDITDATATAVIKGKPAYMSPEQANGQALDGRSDLFAVGVIMWELLVGRRLFLADDTRATIAAVLFGRVPRPRELRPEVPKKLERIVMKLLARDVLERYSTAEAAVSDLLDSGLGGPRSRDALTEILAGLADAPSANGRRAVRVHTTQPPDRVTPSGSSGATPRSTSVRWFVACVLALVIGFGGYVVASRVEPAGPLATIPVAVPVGRAPAVPVVDSATPARPVETPPIATTPPLAATAPVASPKPRAPEWKASMSQDALASPQAREVAASKAPPNCKVLIKRIKYLITCPAAADMAKLLRKELDAVMDLVLGLQEGTREVHDVERECVKTSGFLREQVYGC